jgi:hypothetical protein
MSAFGGKADIVRHAAMSVYDPKRTSRPWLELINSNRLLFRKLLPE